MIGVRFILLVVSAVFFLLAAFGVGASVKWEYLGWACFALSFGF